eukprot:8655268-Pyramimonas_sp.AAC.1
MTSRNLAESPRERKLEMPLTHHTAREHSATPATLVGNRENMPQLTIPMSSDNTRADAPLIP